MGDLDFYTPKDGRMQGKQALRHDAAILPTGLIQWT